VTDSLDTRLRLWRHHLHQHPETAFAEHATSEYVASALEDLGFGSPDQSAGQASSGH
jgi:hippurate hydrolase